MVALKNDRQRGTAHTGTAPANTGCRRCRFISAAAGFRSLRAASSPEELIADEALPRLTGVPHALHERAGLVDLGHAEVLDGA